MYSYYFYSETFYKIQFLSKFFAKCFDLILHHIISCFKIIITGIIDGTLHYMHDLIHNNWAERKFSIPNKFEFWFAGGLNVHFIRHPWAKTSEKGDFRHERRHQFKRFWGHVLNTIQSNLKSGKFLLQKYARICMFFRTLTRNIEICELTMKSRKNSSLSKNWDY